MDEIDSIGSARMESGTGNGDSEVQRTMLELLNQLDGFEASNKIKVLLFKNDEIRLAYMLPVSVKVSCIMVMPLHGTIY
jgi:ATP-dependent 26S proteasome regulatory subunit